MHFELLSKSVDIFSTGNITKNQRWIPNQFLYNPSSMDDRNLKKGDLTGMHGN